jgi:hypothetical protein
MAVSSKVLKANMLAAASLLSTKGNPETVIALNTGKADFHPKDLSPEQWEAKFQFLDE